MIDGQQRLTSLEAAFGFYTGEDRHGSELRCYLDLAAANDESARDTRLFVSYAGKQSVRRRVDRGDSTLIPVSELFNGQNPELRKEREEALRLIPGWDGKRVDGALQRFDRACNMLNQQVPCTTISDVQDRDAVEVFSRLNKGGGALTQGDVRAAELARGHTVRVLKLMRGFVTGKLERRLGFGFNFTFRALVVFHRQSAQFNTLKPDWMDVAGPHGRSLNDSWRASEKAIKKVLKFIDSKSRMQLAGPARPTDPQSAPRHPPRAESGVAVILPCGLTDGSASAEGDALLDIEPRLRKVMGYRHLRVR